MHCSVLLRLYTSVLILLLMSHGAAFAAPMEPQTLQPIYVFGYKDPNAASVTGALAIAHLLNEKGTPATAYRDGTLTPEAQFVLKEFSLPMPEQLPALQGKKVSIVNFSDYAQGPADLPKAKITMITDCHPLGNISTAAPFEGRMEAVGSTNTIVYEMYKDAKKEIPSDIAGGLLAGILLDTSLLRSSSTSFKDQIACEELAALAKIANYRALGAKLITIKTAITQLPSAELVAKDCKEYTVNGKKIAIARIQFTEKPVIDKRIPELVQALQERKQQQQYHSVALMLIDMLRENTHLLVLSDDPSLIQRAFPEASLSQGTAPEVFLPGLTSRKQEVFPALRSALEATPQ